MVFYLGTSLNEPRDNLARNNFIYINYMKNAWQLSEQNSSENKVYCIQ